MNKLEQRTRSVRPTKAEELSAIALGATGSTLILVSLSIPAIQALAWLKTGEWYALPLSKALAYYGWPPPQFDWVGVQKIATYVLDLPSALWVFLSAIGLWWAGGTVHSRIWERPYGNPRNDGPRPS